MIQLLAPNSTWNQCQHQKYRKGYLELLAKVSSTENMTENTLPQELQKLVQNMMKNTFSLENTLARGMGSSMEGQRFSLEQVVTLFGMLTQMEAVTQEQGKTSAFAGNIADR